MLSLVGVHCGVRKQRTMAQPACDETQSVARRRLGRAAPAYRPAPLSWRSSTASTARPSCRRSSSLVVLPIYRREKESKALGWRRSAQQRSAAREGRTVG